MHSTHFIFSVSLRVDVNYVYVLSQGNAKSVFADFLRKAVGKVSRVNAICMLRVDCYALILAHTFQTAFGHGMLTLYEAPRM